MINTTSESKGNNTKKMVHYIFINPHDLHLKKENDIRFMQIANKHKKDYEVPATFTYWNFSDILILLRDYDKELANLFSQINPKYSALMADIGRIIILYKYGGIYHDLKFYAKKEFAALLEEQDESTSIIGEEHPKESFRVRIGNIIAFKTGHVFFKDVLEEMKKRLYYARKYNHRGGKEMFNIGSKTYIDLFMSYSSKRDDMVKIKLEPEYLKFSMRLYRKNYIHWQKINEPIFNH